MPRLFLLALLGVALPALAGGALPLPPTATTAASSQAEPQVLAGSTTARAGQPARLEVTITVPPGFHVYRDMVWVEVVDAAGLSLGEPSLPPGLLAEDPAAPGSMREQYELDAVIELPVAGGAPAGTWTPTISVRYQACKDSLCLFPKTVEVQPTLVVSAS